jgi:hypothetical protein
MTDAAPTAPVARERGWWPVVVATLLFLFVPVTPMLRILLPVDQTIVLLAPILAACAVVGWWAGGRLPLAIMWVALAGWIVWTVTAGAGTFALLACGWAVVLAATFGVLMVVQGADTDTDADTDIATDVAAAPARPLLPRALAAIGLTLILAGGAAIAVPDGAATVQLAAKTEFNHRAEQAVADWRTQMASPDARDFIAKHPDFGALVPQVEQQLQLTPDVALTLFPAVLALESLAALALAWALYHRVGRVRLGPPLRSIREFRFNDQLVWGLIAGLAMTLIPGFGGLSGLGANLLVFFGVLYVLRGAGVALWFLSPGRWMTALLIGLALVFRQELGALALGVGLGDTWLDWRARAKPKAKA